MSFKLSVNKFFINVIIYLFSDLQLQINALNPSAYLIRDGRPSHGSYRQPKPSSPVKNIPPNTLPLPYKTTDSKPKSTFNDNKFHIAPPSHRRSQTRIPQYPQLDSTGSYPDSDYISLSSNHNYSQGHIHPFKDPKYHYNPHNINTLKPPVQNSGYYNHGYGNYPTYRSNSTRDDDETTTTSGSYTINHEDLDDDLAAAQFQVSQVV